jgi:hypothetical protein
MRITSPAAPAAAGDVRETVELILRCQGTWQKVVARLRGQDW